MFLAEIACGFLNWQVALNTGGLTVDKPFSGYGVTLMDSGPGVVRIHIGDPTMTGQFQPTVTPQQLQ